MVQCAGGLVQSCTDPTVYIVAIAWLYVVLLMALTEPSIIAGIASFVLYGLLPLALLLWLVGTPQRRRNRSRVDPDE
jgi:hypothetical protein